MMESPRRLRNYYGSKNPRVRVHRMLQEHGSMNIQVIHAKYNSTWRTGLSMSELAAILSGDKRFIKTGEEKIRSIAGKLYTSTIWGVSVVE